MATTAGSTHQHSQAHHAITAGQHISQSSLGSILSTAAKHIRSFANLGIRLFAGKGKIEIQAQDNDVEIKARQVIDFIARQAINVHSDKRVRLQVGPHRIEITPGGGIELFSPKALQFNTGSLMFKDGKAAVPVVIPDFRVPEGLFNHHILMVDSLTGVPLAEQPYKLIYKNKIIEGVTDKEGRTKIIATGDQADEVSWQIIGVKENE